MKTITAWAVVNMPKGKFKNFCGNSYFAIFNRRIDAIDWCYEIGFERRGQNKDIKIKKVKIIL